MNNLSINCLTKNKIKKKDNIDFNINTLKTDNKPIYNGLADELIEARKFRREKLLGIFNDLYNECIEKIKLYDLNGKIDLVFVVPSKIDSDINYSSQECIEFIKRKLKEIYIDTLFLNDVTLFITWKYIEINQFNHNKNDSKDNND